MGWTAYVSEHQDGKKSGAADRGKKRRGLFLFWGSVIYYIVFLGIEEMMMTRS